MSNVVTMRPDAPATQEQEIAAIVDDYLKTMAAIGIDLTEQDDDEDDEQE
jgi:hypothetical protein